jgi:hypothetical protein
MADGMRRALNDDERHIAAVLQRNKPAFNNLLSQWHDSLEDNANTSESENPGSRLPLRAQFIRNIALDIKYYYMDFPDELGEDEERQVRNNEELSDDNAEGEYEIDADDAEDFEDDIDDHNYGFIYSRYSTHDYYDK